MPRALPRPSVCLTLTQPHECGPYFYPHRGGEETEGQRSPSLSGAELGFAALSLPPWGRKGDAWLRVWMLTRPQALGMRTLPPTGRGARGVAAALCLRSPAPAMRGAPACLGAPPATLAGAMATSRHFLRPQCCQAVSGSQVLHLRADPGSSHSAGHLSGDTGATFEVILTEFPVYILKWKEFQNAKTKEYFQRITVPGTALPKLPGVITCQSLYTQCDPARSQVFS